jgi:hypothetical protein
LEHAELSGHGHDVDAGLPSRRPGMCRPRRR